MSEADIFLRIESEVVEKKSQLVVYDRRYFYSVPITIITRIVLYFWFTVRVVRVTVLLPKYSIMTNTLDGGSHIVRGRFAVWVSSLRMECSRTKRQKKEEKKVQKIGQFNRIERASACIKYHYLWLLINVFAASIVFEYLLNAYNLIETG